jgi:hypothetical protein
MTITRRFQCGAEEGSLAMFYATSDSASVTTAPKTGSRHFNIDSGTNPSYLQVQIPSTYQIRTGMAQRLGQSGGKTIFIFGDIDLVTNGSDIDLRVSASVKDTATGVNTNTPYRNWGIDLKIDPTNGWVKVYVDGDEVASFTGNTGSSAETIVTYGKTATANYNTDLYIDDIYIDDTTGETEAALPPILYFYYVTPNDNGYYSNWTPSSGSGYQCVDEVPASAADYVEAIAVDKVDSYDMSTFTIPAGGEILAIIPQVLAKRDASTEEIALGTRLSSTDLVGSDQAPSSSAGYLFERQTTKPGGGSWDQSALDAVQALIKSRGTY